MNIDQNIGKILKLSGRDRFSAYFTYTAVWHDLSLDQYCPVFFNRYLKCLHLTDLLLPGETKGHFNERILTSAADHVLICLRSKRKINRADDYGLTGTGFSCENIQTTFKFNFLLIDQCKILNMQII